VELLIQNGTVVTMDRDHRVLPSSDVLVQDGRIAKIGRVRQGRRARRVIDASGCVVLPGFVQGHLHACQTLFRNRADGLELLDWLRERIWPFEAAHDAQSLRASADLTWAELIKSGSTAALDMGTVRHQDAVFESARDAGFRLTSGKAMMDQGQGMPAGLRETTEDSIAESVRLCDAWHLQAGGRLRYAFAPRFALSCSERLLVQVAELARARGIRVHSHVSENATECDLVRQRTGMDNVAYFHHLGITGPHVTLAHGVWLTAEEHRLLRATRTVLCHCPSSNLKLASGIAKIPELLAEGVQVALGADGAPCNNTLDMFVEMRLAALIHKPRVASSSTVQASIPSGPTRGGARAMGLEEEIGSLEPGKRADVCILDLGRPSSTPGGAELAAQIVYSGSAECVRDVLIDGQPVLRNRALLTLDEPSVLDAANRESERIASRVG
jgi:5-methylthioadenosine/S-adenosylhomocysteine deaminase